MLIRVHSTTTENAKMCHVGPRCEEQQKTIPIPKRDDFSLNLTKTTNAVSVPPSEELTSQTAALGTRNLNRLHV